MYNIGILEMKNKSKMAAKKRQRQILKHFLLVFHPKKACSSMCLSILEVPNIVPNSIKQL